MRKILVIAQHDFLCTVRRKGYIIMTLAMPFIFGLMGLMAAAPTFLMLHSHQQTGQIVHAVDNTDGLLTSRQRLMKQRIQHIARTEGSPAAKREILRFLDYLLNSPIKVHRDEAQARQILQNKHIDLYYVVGPDYLQSGRISAITRDDTPTWVASLGVEPLREALIDGLLSERSSPEILERVKHPVDLQVYGMTPDGKLGLRRPLMSLLQNSLPYAFGILMVVCVFITSGYLLQSLTEEKSSRILELLMASARPEDLVLGKLIGLGGAGFLQFLLWLAFAIVPLLTLTTLVIGPWMFPLMLIYFVLGFILFGCLTFSVASLTNTSKESQHVAGVWSLVAAVPLLISPLIVKSPQSSLPMSLSLFPFTSPVTMILRVATGSASPLDILASIAIQAGTIVLLIRLAARLLQVSMLLRGKFPSLRELWHAART